MAEVIKSRPVNDVSSFQSQVDIIIPFHGQYEKVTALIDSIFNFTRSNYYKICVVDDASINEQYIKNIRKNGKGLIKTLRCKEQKGFGGSIKAAFERTESPYVCFVNSDCRFETIDWLRSMGESLLNLKDQGVRMIAPKTNNPANGGDFMKGEKLDRGDDVILDYAADPKNNFLSMYCFMCHRELFSRCGGFIKDYPFGFYEDEEFAYRMHQNGFKQAVCGNSWVYHEGAATIKSIWRKRPDVVDIMEKDNKKRMEADMGL